MYVPQSLTDTVFVPARHRRSVTSYGPRNNGPLTTVGNGTIIYQAPMRPLVPQHFTPVGRNIDRAKHQGGYVSQNYKATRKDYHSDPLTQTWTPKPGYSKSFHVVYSSGSPGAFQYRRLSTTTRQRGYTSDPTAFRRGIRNPPKRVSDDARINSDLSNSEKEYIDDDLPAWVPATALPPDHALSPDPHPRRPSRTSSFGAGGQILDYRNRDPGNFRDVIQPQLSASEPVLLNMDKGAALEPRFVSNPFEMERITEETRSPTHTEMATMHTRQRAPPTAIEYDHAFQEQQVPIPRTPQHTYHHSQPDPYRSPLTQMQNMSYSSQIPASLREDPSRFRLWVGNLLPQTTRNELVEMFRYLPGFVDIFEPMEPRKINSPDPKNRFTFIQ